MVTADEARQLRQKKGVVNHETYKMIYAKIQNRITYAASKGYTKTDYVIPSIIPGRPMFSVSHAIRYVRDKLRYNGFEVTELPHSDTIRIDWGPPQHTPPPPQQQRSKDAKKVPYPMHPSPSMMPASSENKQKQTKEQKKRPLSESLAALKSKLHF